ncbi:hypothetical protein ELE36_06465 [Pseudolysobacter antarcticus]|uniref:Fibronectin type-III domain-containing protein n=1 Tax=Pseudolysobacter antarcticus TaxID=2511995 RepID=A0A411HHL8_9GAMM|nr:DUF11 domain-containing protein [Pseudolysobacter antarcticus]QBB70032.1 hypothetical protein ELE36_06465 [Pseudolysobacter antarcticus]
MNRVWRKVAIIAACMMLTAIAHAGAFIGSNNGNPDLILHALGYNGAGGAVEPIRVCLDIQANQAMAVQAEPALIKAIATLNRFRSLPDHNFGFDSASEVGPDQLDFESVILHELLHSLGLGHPNLADESGLPSPQNQATKTTSGTNQSYDVNAGADGVYGSADDTRGDDVNLHWYQRYVNNPGVLADVIDTTTMARTLNYLPAGHSFATNADRYVMAALGYTDVEAIVHQGARLGESQRHLAHDDIATLRLAQAGVDGIAGTADDYRMSLIYSGRQVDPQGWACEIALRFDTGTSLATTTVGSFQMSGSTNHWGVYYARTVANPNVNWYFTSGPNTQVAILAVSPELSLQQQPVSVQVQVNKTAGSTLAGYPQGVVEVRDGPRSDAATAYCSITLAGTNGETGQCQLTPQRAGNKTIVADYLGYAGFDGGSASAAHVVNGTVSFATANATPNPAAVGVPVNIQWTLLPNGGALPASATGTVTVKEVSDCATPAPNAEVCSATLPANQCTITFTSAGSKSLSLCYSGDSAIAAAQAPLGVQVNAARATTTTIVSHTPDPAATLAPITVQASVAESPALGGFPSGAITVLDGAAGDPLTATCSITLAGSSGEIGTCTLVPLRAGSKTLTANFAAQGLWAASTASTTMATRSFSITRNAPNISRLHQGVSVSIGLDVAAYLGAPAPTGTVTISDGAGQCQIVLPATECLWSGSNVGLRNLSATWPGDANYAAMTSAPVIQNVVADSYPQLLSLSRTAYADSDGASSASSLAMSFDGRYVAFASSADQLVNGDSNAVADIFVRDMQTGNIRRASTSTFGVQASAASAEPAISANGRYVAFTSLAGNLVAGDSNQVRDVFVKDMSTGALVRASLRSDGSEDTTPNEYYSMSPALSADGRYVAFAASGSLVPSDGNGFPDIYVRDLVTGQLDLVSSDSNDIVGSFRSFTPAISADGRYVAFVSQSFNFSPLGVNAMTAIYIKDRLTRKLTMVSAAADGTPANNYSYETPAISADGNLVAFMSLAQNLTAGTTFNDYRIFVKNMTTGAISLGSAQANGVAISPAHNPTMSADGRYVGFSVQQYTPLMRLDVFIKDRQTAAITRANLGPSGALALGGDSDVPAISGNGRFVAFQSAATNLVAADNNGLTDEFVRDLQTQTTTRISAIDAGTRSDGASAEASISRDGRYAVFSSLGSGLVASDSNAASDIFVVDRNTLLPLRMSVDASGVQANGASDSPAISATGAWVSFRSSASNLVSGDSNGGADIFIKNIASGTISLVSTSSIGAQSAGGVILGPTSLSSDGNLVVFRASDGSLVAGDNNGFEDVFVKNRSNGVTSLISASASGTIGNGNSVQAVISDDGTRVVFASDASNFAADDSNGVRDIYVKTLASGAIVRASSDASGVIGNAASSDPSISADGRFVVFASAASNLVAGDTNGNIDIFVKDLNDASITRINTTAAGAQGSGGDCATPSISSDGRYVGFICAQSNLVAADSNAFADAFVKDRQTGAITRVSLSAANVQADGPSAASARAIADAGLMLFTSTADNLVTGNAQRIGDVYINRYASLTLSTTTTITAQTPNPAQINTAYNVTVGVTRIAGASAITGSVSIGEGATFCIATLSGSGATATGQCALTSTSIGARQLSASYSGDANYAASNAAAAVESIIDTRVPSAPMIGIAIGGNASVSVNFSAPTSEGGSSISGYTATCGSASQSGLSSPITVSGLSNGIAVTCSVIAKTNNGSGPASAPSNSVVPAAAPSAPTAPVATRGNKQVSVVFSAPVNNGGSAVLDYTAYCGGMAQTAASSPIIVGGLSNGIAVSCSVIAHSAVGRSGPSLNSNTVIPATMPDAPTSVIAIRGNTQVSVAFTTPANNGDVIQSYSAQCGSKTQIGSTSPIIVGGLSNGIAVTCSVTASNSIGAGLPSLPSNSVTPATIPDAPQLIAVAPSSGQLHLLFNPPAQNGGSVISSYSGICTPGTHAVSGASSPLTLASLSNGTAYTCVVIAINSVGASIASNALGATPQSSSNLTISNSNGADFLRGGGSTSYLIDVTNNGADAINGAHVLDTLGTQFSQISWICSGTGGGTCTASGNGSIDTLVNLPASGQVSFLLSATVATLPETPLSNTATVTAPDSTISTATDGPDTIGIFRSGFD